MDSVRLPCRVTIVVVPRERFSCAVESLDSVLEHTRALAAQIDLDIVYVDGGSPAGVRDQLAARAEAHDLTLVRVPHYLSPNQARNIGLRYATGDWIVFVDNDIIASPGWLEAMLECAQATGAWIVTPLTCEGSPYHQTVHCAGGIAAIEERPLAAEGSSRHIVERLNLQKRRVAAVRPTLARTQTRLAEFHCMLVRRSVFERVGPLDEQFLNTKEHIDLCLQVQQAGGTIWFEPDAVVTYVFDRPLAVTDFPYFMLRWSDAWEAASLRHMMRKWNLAEEGYFENRLANRGWRRNLAIWRPVARRLSLGWRNKTLSRALFLIDRGLNPCVTAVHRHMVARGRTPEVRMARRIELSGPQ